MERSSERRRGRQKVEMVKMEKESNLQVTFSKRRSGLFKKASELCTLCGAEVGLIVFSPGNKVFSFGHPELGTIVDRYLQRTPLESAPLATVQIIEAHRNAYVNELNMQLTQVMSQLEAAKKRGEELSKIKSESQSQNWWEGPIEELSLEQLKQLKATYEVLKKKLARQAENLVIQNSNTQQQFFMGGSSSGAAAGSLGSGGLVPNYEALLKNINNNVQFNSNMMMNQEYNNNPNLNNHGPNNMITPTGPGYNPNMNPCPNMIMPSGPGYNPNTNPGPNMMPPSGPSGYNTNPGPNMMPPPSPGGYNPNPTPNMMPPLGPYRYNPNPEGFNPNPQGYNAPNPQRYNPGPSDQFGRGFF